MRRDSESWIDPGCVISCLYLVKPAMPGTNSWYLNLPILLFDYRWSCVCLLLDTYASQIRERLGLGEDLLTYIYVLENLLLPLDLRLTLFWKSCWLVKIKEGPTGDFLISPITKLPCYSSSKSGPLWEWKRAQLQLSWNNMCKPRLSQSSWTCGHPTYYLPLSLATTPSSWGVLLGFYEVTLYN